eukprot:175942-Rhodomonas_salina.1
MKCAVLQAFVEDQDKAAKAAEEEEVDDEDWSDLEVSSSRPALFNMFSKTIPPPWLCCSLEYAATHTPTHRSSVLVSARQIEPPHENPGLVFRAFLITDFLDFSIALSCG